jgi:hypothetical protein
MIVSENSIARMIEMLTDKIGKLENEIDVLKKRIITLPKIANTIKVERIQIKECTCHSCAEGLQICGEEINWVCGPIDEELPIRVYSTFTDGLLWWFESDRKIEKTESNEYIPEKWSEPTENDEDLWWTYGSTAEDAIIEYLYSYISID